MISTQTGAVAPGVHHVEAIEIAQDRPETEEQLSEIGLPILQSAAALIVRFAEPARSHRYALAERPTE